MVDAVNTVSLQGTASRSSPQVASAVAPVSSASADSTSADFITSGIVVDNLQNMAILEYRSSRTGEIVAQYPTEAQIESFRSAEQIQRAAAQHVDVPQQAPAAPQQGVMAPVLIKTAAAPVHVPAPAPAPAGSTGSKHSVIA